MIGRLFGCVAVCGWLIASGTLQAHHALDNIYDRKNEEILSGTLVRILMSNPHGSLTMSVKNPDGSTTEWVFATASAATLAARGIGTNPNMLEPGDRITAKFFPARHGPRVAPLGYLLSITTAGGTTFDTSDGWSRKPLEEPTHPIL